MRTRTPRVAALVAAALLVVLPACSDDGDTTSDATTTVAADAPDDTDGPDVTNGVEPVPGDAVSIADFAFGPDALTVSVGDTVTWTNDDATTHTSTADDDSWNSEDIAPGDGFEHTLNEAGTFTYHCNIHSSMTGTVTVEA